jgi:hypothetical protein
VIVTPARVVDRLPAGVVAPNDLAPGLVAFPFALADSSVHTLPCHRPIILSPSKGFMAMLPDGSLALSAVQKKS